MQHLDKYTKLYQEIIEGSSCKGVRFDDLRYLLENTGFSLRMDGGDHFRYSMDGVSELINIQPDKRDKKSAKEYQVHQIRKLFRKYKLGGGKL